MIERRDGLVAEPLLRWTAGGAKRLVEIRYEGDDGPARRRPKYASSLLRIAFRIPDLPTTDYHIKLSDLYSTEDERICSATKSRKGLHSSHTQSMRALGPDVQNHGTAHTQAAWRSVSGRISSAESHPSKAARH